MEVWEVQRPFCSSYSAFKELKRVFDYPISGQEASKRLLSLQLNGQSAAEYTFSHVVLQKGLSETLQDELVTREPSTTLESLIDLGVRLDNRLRERKLESPVIHSYCSPK